MVKLHDGRQISIDLYKVTRREFSRFGEKDTPEDENNEVIAKASSLTVADVEKLPQPDFDKLVLALYSTRRDLMSNPT
jgi:hypothetical protein